jgi:hypothetical protein
VKASKSAQESARKLKLAEQAERLGAIRREEKRLAE